MIIRSLARRPGALQSLAQRTCRAPFARHLHAPPTLTNQPELEANGIPGLFSKKQFEIAFTQYQRHIIDQLNMTTGGTKYENTDIKSLVIDCARDPMNAFRFNAASMAFNNHFFFRGINTNPDITSKPSADLLPLINDNFTSLDSLRETFLLTAEAMFGPGFVWLVQTDDTQAAPLKILTTYIAGSPLSGAHYRRQPEDLNTHNIDSYPALNPAGAFGTNSRQKDNKPKKPLGGVDITPLLCVNTWEHAWLHDYGIGGKMEYLERWWDKIDWEQVRQYARIRSDSTLPQSAGQGSRKFNYA